jgi:hypothetical protein
MTTKATAATTKTITTSISQAIASIPRMLSPTKGFRAVPRLGWDEPSTG